jgi:hypothetical protein
MSAEGRGKRTMSPDGQLIANVVGKEGGEIGQANKLPHMAITAARVKGAYGVGRGQMDYEPADAALPTETLWNTQPYMSYAPKLFEALRETHGFDHHL